jgi:hypothetical protein
MLSRRSLGEAASRNRTASLCAYVRLAFFAPAFLAGDFFVLELEAFMALAGFFFAPLLPAVFVVLAFIAMAVLLHVAAGRSDRLS